MKIRLFLVICSVMLGSLLITTVAAAGGPITHRVSVGGPDYCAEWGTSPGCDKNFSLVAIQYADGSVSGQWTDQWSDGTGGFHAEINCLSIKDNDAWVSGVVTTGFLLDTDTGEKLDLAGWTVSTRIRDNGTSANDPADQISYSYPYDICTEQPDYPLFQAPQGQVVVR